MAVIVHGVIGSPYVRATLLGLEERGVRYQLAAIAFGAHLERIRRLLTSPVSHARSASVRLTRPRYPAPVRSH